jgi:methionine-rich copper-binding protein CopC
MKTKLIPLIVLSGLTLCGLPAHAQITVVNTGFLNEVANQTSYTLSFDAGNGGTADKLIVSAGVESPLFISGITYNGVPLTLIPNTGGGNGRNRGIWYLDNPFSGGAADIVVSGDGVTAFSHMRLGVASISGSAPGAAIGNIAGAASVSINVPVNNSFVFAAHASNSATPATTADPPLTQIFGVTGDSANMAAGYENFVAAGPATYSFTSVSSPSSSAAAFVPTNAAPVIVSTTPADNATDAAIGADLVATFSEPVVAGTGNIQLWQVGGGSPVESFNVASSPQLTFSGQTLTINPTANLTPGVEYYVLIPATAVVDTTGGNAFAGISDPTAWSFTADGTAPTLVSLNPADNSPAVPVFANLVVTFSESVFAGTGNVELWQVGGGTPVESFDVTNSSQLTFSGATLTINPTNNLTPGVGYYVLIPSTAVKDLSGNAFAGISDPTAWSFTADGTPPTLVTLSPADGANFVAVNVNLVATFSEAVVAGTGNIQLWKAGGGTPVESFDVTNSSQLTFSGATLTINPTADLDTATNYYVIIPATAVKDPSGNFFNGLTAATDWNFTTVAPPPALTLLNTTNFTDTTSYADTKTYTRAFDPDDTADALVVILTTEAQAATASVTWDGVPMQQVYPLAGNDPVGVYYLNNPTNVGLANVNVTVTRNPSGGNISGVGFTVMALSNPGNFPITNTAYLIQTGPASVDPIPLVVSSTGSFVVAGFSSSDGSGGVNITATPNLTLLHKGDFGSVQGFFGYEQNVSAGTNTYQFSFTGTKTFAAAVAFAAVPTAPSGPTLTSVAPNPVTGSSYAVTLGLTGSGFTGATAVLLTNVTAATGASYVPTVNSDTSISVSFVPGTAPTSWNATVVNVTPSAQVPFTVSAPPAISINSSSLTSAGPGNVVLSGTGGTAGQSYAVLSATNVTLPMASWTPLVTTVFGPGGSFSYTNVVNPGTPKLFLRIKQ